MEKYLDKQGLIRLVDNLTAKINSKETTYNKITEFTETCTDEQYPSAKLVYDTITDNESVIADALNELNNIKVDKVEGKDLSTNDFTTAYMNKLSGIENNATYTTESTVANWGFTKNTGTVTYVGVKMNNTVKGSVTTTGVIDLGTVITAHQDISGKVDKETGKGLSTNDYTTSEKNKLAEIESGAQKNVKSDWNETNSSSYAYILNKPNLSVFEVSSNKSNVLDENSTIYQYPTSYIVYNTIADTEEVIAAALNDINTKKENVSNKQNILSDSTTYYPTSYAVKSVTDNKQDIISDLETIRNNAYTALSKSTTIETKIPNQATSSNQLADKNFVNSSIATNTAEFKGIYDTVNGDVILNLIFYYNTPDTNICGDFGLVFSNGTNTGLLTANTLNDILTIKQGGNIIYSGSKTGSVQFIEGSGLITNPITLRFTDTEREASPYLKFYLNHADAAAIQNQYIDDSGPFYIRSMFELTTFSNDTYEGVANANDYGFVRVAVGNNSEYRRYKYSEFHSKFKYEYTLNNSSFTSAQWAAINSGIIAEMIPSGTSESNKLVNATGLNGKQDTLVSGTNIKTINNQSVLGSGNIDIGGSNPLVEITYANLVTLRTNSQLVPGQQYRITDYNTTVTGNNYTVGGHQFDIIVVADSSNKLNEVARAIQHSGDTYFSDCKLESWELKYCLDNDTNRFNWADTSTGKGVIYWMKDEWNNECPYDFKNIQFKRKLTNGYYNPTTGTDKWVYTFNWTDNSGNTSDLSVEQFVHQNDEGGYSNTYSNVIKEYREDNNGNYGPLSLNNIVFLSCEDYDGGMFYGYYGNTFGNDCYYNTFGNYCSYNTFGNGCSLNTFGNGCSSNTFGNGCYHNTFGNGCYSNTFGNDCYSNTFGNSCYSNTFGNNCRSNTFGNYCRSNTFGNECQSNTFGNECDYNTFGTNCISNKFASNSTGTAGHYFQYIILDNGAFNNILYNTETASYSNYVQNYRIKSSMKFNYNTATQVSRNLSYDTTVAKNSSGVIKQYCEADLIA